MKQSLVQLISLSSFSIFSLFANKPINTVSVQKPSTVIILNGPSASGKSTLQKAIQNTFDALYLTMGIDDFFDRPLSHNFDAQSQSIVQNELVRKGVRSVDADGKPVFTLVIGPAGRRAVTGMHRAFEAYASAGNNLVIDYTIYEPDWLPELVECLKNHRVYFIGITTPLEVIEQREKSRGTSPVGLARSHFNMVHAHNNYDLELNTSSITAQEAAERIKEFIQRTPCPQAFKKISGK